jgi:hypothetical protein
MFGEALSTYLQFVLDNAPYFYYVPGSGVSGGRGVAAAAFAIDFLYEAYSDSRCVAKKAEIYDKIVSLADWILTQQCADPAKKAYGGFKSNEKSDYYYAIDACRVVPSLLRVYSLTDDVDYLISAKLAGFTFLKTMQDEQNYGGLARAVTINDDWLLQMDIECLYGLIGLKMLAETYDSDNANVYQGIMVKLVDFLRIGFENLWLYYDPSDNAWHRAGLEEDQIYDDCFAYALLGLYNYEGWSPTVQRVYETVNAIGPSSDYAGYNPNFCWTSYLDIVRRKAVADEFCSTLDRDTAKIVAFNIQKLARQMGRAVVVATTHTDLFEDLKPSVHVHKRFGKEITVNYYANEAAKECSLTKEMRVEEGAFSDYKRLSVFHYRSSRCPPPRKVFVLKRDSELCGVIVYSYPSSICFGRSKVWKGDFKKLQREMSLISRVVVHPKYRSIGLGVKIVKETLARAGTPYVEALAVMAKYNPFFEKAGM